MSCMNNVDPYNNAPPPRPGSKCASGGCGIRPGPPQQAQKYIDPQTEVQMLRADLQVAINYIQSLGGRWPPPGH